MKLDKILRAIAIVAYFLIFVSGEHIGGPLIILMLFAIYNSDIYTQIICMLAFVALFSLLLIAFSKKRILTLVLEGIIFILLLLPIISDLSYETLRELRYQMFVIPTLSFISFYFLSLFFSYKEYRENIAIKI